MLYVYVGCLFFGILFSVLSFLLGGDGFDFDGFDVDGGVDFPNIFNPLVVTSSITVFGASGIIGMVGFDMNGATSALISLVIALVIGAAIFFGIVRFAYNSQSNSAFSQNDLIGLDCEVVTPIPLKGVGEIVYVINGERHSLPAKCSIGETINKGETVRIKEIAGNMALVSRKMTINDIDIPGRDFVEDRGSET